MQKGDWVTFKNYNDEKTIVLPAIVEGVYKESGFCLIRPYNRDKGKFIDIKIRRDIEELTMYAKAAEKEDLKDLINLALDSGDKEWFYNLTDQLRGLECGGKTRTC